MIHDNRVLDLLLLLVVLAPCVILHEVAHGWVAERLGDPTARRAGRITLNPVRHVDPVGSLLLPSMLALAGQNVWGWARPVPVDPGRFSRPTEGMAVVALAGPATNLALAAVGGRLGPLVDLAGGGDPSGVALWSGIGIGITTAALWGRVVFAFVVVNAALAVFNMLPIPPLDGSRLLPLALSRRGREAYARIAPYGILILLALIFLFRDALSFLGGAVGWVVRWVV